MAMDCLTIEAPPYDGGEVSLSPDRGGAKLRVFVVHTTPEGTIAALRAAAKLSRDLDARIVLLAAEAVPVHFSMAQPHVPLRFLERRLYGFIREAGIVDEEFSVLAALCRHRKLCLRAMLPPHSLVVIGTDPHWWHPYDRRIAEWLRTEQHQHVIAVRPEHRTAASAKMDQGRLATYLRSLQLEVID
jgi:hypothetical protein